MPPDGVVVLPKLTQNPVPVQEGVKQPLIKPQQATLKVEKQSLPLTEEQRKKNQELFSKLGIPSIAALRQKEEKLNENEATSSVPSRQETFDAPAFTKAWENICSRIKEMGKDSLLVTLTRHPYEVDFATYIVKLTIDNKVQEQDINRERQWILDMLRDILRNDQLNFEIIFSQSQTINTPYTSKEKFMKMVEKNPSLIYLAEKLKLDL